MNLFLKNSIKLVAKFGLFYLSIFTFSSGENVYASRVCEENPPGLKEDCYVTPATYKIRIYEMGLCTADPLPGIVTDGINNPSDNSIDESSCSPTFQSSSGFLIDLAGFNAQNLVGKNISPPPGSYSSGYIKMKNTFGLKGSYTINNQTYYSQSDGSAGSVESYSEFLDTINDFDSLGACSIDPRMSGWEVFNTGVTGTTKGSLAIVNGGNLGTYSGASASECGSTDHLFVSFSPTSPILINEDTKGLQVNFVIKDSGLVVSDGGDISTGGIQGFLAGPPRLHFSVF